MEHYEDLCKEFLEKHPNRKCDPEMIMKCVREIMGVDVVRIRQYDNYMEYLVKSVDKHNGVDECTREHVFEQDHVELVECTKPIKCANDTQVKVPTEVLKN